MGKTPEETLSGMLVRGPHLPAGLLQEALLWLSQVAPGQDAASTGLTGMRARRRAKHGLSTWAESLLEGFFSEQELRGHTRKQQHTRPRSPQLVLWFLVQTPGQTL